MLLCSAANWGRQLLPPNILGETDMGACYRKSYSYSAILGSLSAHCRKNDLMPTEYKSKSPLKKTQCEAKRTTYLQAINRGVTTHQACIQTGLEPHAAMRINRRLAETCSLGDRPLSGRPHLHTDQVFQDAEAV